MQILWAYSLAMNRTRTVWAVLLSVAALLMGLTGARGQSADAILDKLVEKGILTQDEARQLRDEADKNFRAAYQSKSGLLDWVTALRVNGDFRARYDALHGWDTTMPDRNRFRYRARLGVTALMWDNLEAGIRLTSSEPVDSFGGDPISGNATFQDNASKKFLYVDLAYGRWTPLDTYSFRNTLGVGKFENPFTFSEMVFDPDYTPEGAFNQFTYTINDFHSLRWTTLVGVLDELGASSHDPLLLGTAVQWDALWSLKEGRRVMESSLGVGVLGLRNPENLPNSAVPNQNVGNSRDTNGVLRYHYNPIVVQASFTYTLERFPYYSGFFPMRLAGEFMVNPAVSERNTGWWVGAFFGRPGRRRTWELSYRYKYLEADAWYEEMVDSDFGAYYEATPGGWAYRSGRPSYGAGTNAKGHVLRASLSPADALTLSVTYALTDLASNPGRDYGTSDTIGRLLLDAVWRF